MPGWLTRPRKAADNLFCEDDRIQGQASIHDEDIDIQEEFHGKSERSSGTDSVVSGGWFSGAAKIIAPVCGQRTRRGF